MTKSIPFFFFGLALMAQPPEGFGGGPGGRQGGGFMRFNPIFQALDTDGDGELSKKEIKNAAKALWKLDKNGDGQITADEVRPNFPQGGPGEFRRGPQGGERRGPEGGGPGGNDPEELVRTLMAFDKNGDGKLSKDELPERMQGMLERGDANHDGFLTPDEIRAMALTQSQRAQGGPGGPEGRGGPGGPGGRRMDPLFAALDTNHDGVLSREEIEHAPESLLALDANGDGKLTMEELRPTMPGGGGVNDRRRRDQ